MPKLVIVLLCVVLGLASCSQPRGPAARISKTQRVESPIVWQGWIDEGEYIFWRGIAVDKEIVVSVSFLDIPQRQPDIDLIIVPDEDMDRWYWMYDHQKNRLRTLAVDSSDVLQKERGKLLASWSGHGTVAVVIANYFRYYVPGSLDVYAEVKIHYR